MSVEGVVTVTTAVTALITVPVTLVAARWSSRSTDNSAGATVLAGHGQAVATVEAVRIQAHAEREKALEEMRFGAYAEFLTAASLFVRAVNELPDFPSSVRASLLDEKANSVVRALAGVELLAPPAVAARARDVSVQCSRLEKLALRRAVLRSALSMLEANWCPRDAEQCRDSHHGSAFLSWELLTEWSTLEDEERWENLDLLRYALENSQALDADHVQHVVEVANHVAHWNNMLGGWVRDPMLERFYATRAEYVEFAYGSLHSRSV
ncbi:hypothetical protein OG863_15900 [Streptomyces decoyicus]|uniref:Uncharacterized protein n=1 Tax=Streptomyces decoyicus TaxID=249567 RepID=A0ABZ1FGZ5_9ACTN|nr:hypothetical protein [Streptomyces decoyicus]WSB69318.1 hypothetical protein OG863_15900 [Streptomyces decoyicus]